MNEKKIAGERLPNSSDAAADDQSQVRLLVLLKKKPNVSDEDFAAHWREVHGKMVSELPGLLRYTQYHVQPVNDFTAGTEGEIRGVAEMWFASNAALNDAMNTPLGKRITKDANETFGTPEKNGVRARETLLAIKDIVIFNAASADKKQPK